MRQKHRFTYKLKDDNDFLDKKVVVETEAVSLDELVLAFEDYLKACGFSLDGVHLDLVEEDDSDEA